MTYETEKQHDRNHAVPQNNILFYWTASQYGFLIHTVGLNLCQFSVYSLFAKPQRIMRLFFLRA